MDPTKPSFIYFFLWIHINVVTCSQLKFVVVCSQRELRLAECDAWKWWIPTWGEKKTARDRWVFVCVVR